MADSEHDESAEPRVLTEKQWDEYQKLKRKNEELEKSNKEFYDGAFEASTTIDKLKHDLDEQKNRVRLLEAEEKKLRRDLDGSHTVQKENERLQRKLNDASKEREQLTNTHEDLKSTFVKLEHDNTKKARLLSDFENELEDLKTEMLKSESEVTMHKQLAEAYEDELENVSLAKDRLEELHSRLNERNILGRKLSKDIAEYNVNEIHKLLIEAIAEAGDRTESPESFRGDLRNPRQRGRNRQVSMQDELEDMDEDLDGWNVESPSMVAITPDVRSPQGSYFSPDLQRRESRPTVINEGGDVMRPTFRPDQLDKSRTQTILSIEPTTAPVDKQVVTPLQTILPSKIIRRVSTAELIQSLPVWLWPALLIGLWLLIKWVYMEREMWLSANELSRQAATRLRESRRMWLPELPARLVYDFEHLLGVQKGLMG